jgi:hypothetical protein
MTSRADKMSAGHSRAAYMREYRKRKRLEEDNCNNVPERIKLQAEQKRECRETLKNLSAEYMRNYINRKAHVKHRKTKHHKHLGQLTLHQLQLYIIIIKPINSGGDSQRRLEIFDIF